MHASPEPTFEITRRFEAPRDVVWDAWSDPDRLQHWWGPAGCVIEVLRCEFRAGGFFHYAMRFDGQPTMWGRFAYREIVERRRLVWLNAFANDRCGIARAPFSEACPLEIENTVTMTEDRGATIVHLRAEPFGALDVERDYFTALRPSLDEGYGGTLEQLRALLATG